MKLGITSYAYRWAIGTSDFRPHTPLSIFDLVERASSLGLKVLQVCENADSDLTLEDYERLRESAKKRGITLELGTVGMDSSTLNRYANLAELTGSRLLRIYPKKREPIEKLVERIRGFLPTLRDRKITLAIENSSMCVYTCHQLAEILSRVGDPTVGACVDSANSLGLIEKPLETVKVLSPYAVSVHLKDFSIRRKSVGGFEILGVPLGEGMLDVEAVLSIIEEYNRDPNILLEQWMKRRVGEEETLKEEERWLKKSIAFLHSVL